MENIDLVKMAKKAMENAHVPYSKFRVGAALVTKDGNVYTGCNIENASFGATNCAERTAIFKAVSEGTREITKIAIISDSKDYTYPCGICRQVIAEFGTMDMDIIVSTNDEKFKVHKLKDLLPYAFTEQELERGRLNE